MDVQQQNDGVDELVLQGVNAGLSVGSKMGRAAGRRFMDTAYGPRTDRRSRREDRKNRRENRRENRQHWRQTRRSVRGMRKDEWWNEASPAKIANASANLRDHAGDGLWKRFTYWRFRRQCLKRYGIDPERVHQNLGPENSGPERQQASARLDKGVEALIGNPQVVQQIQQDHRRLAVDENYRDQQFHTPVLVPVALVPVSLEDNPWVQAGRDQQQASEKENVVSETPEVDGDEVRGQVADSAMEQGTGVDGVDADHQGTDASELEGVSDQDSENPRAEGEQVGEGTAEPEAEPAGDDEPQPVSDGQAEGEADLEQDTGEPDGDQDAQAEDRGEHGETETEGPEAEQPESQGSAVEEQEAAEENTADGLETEQPGAEAEGPEGSAGDGPETQAEGAENTVDSPEADAEGPEGSAGDGPEAEGDGPEHTADVGPDADGAEAPEAGSPQAESGPEATPEPQEAEGQGSGAQEQNPEAGPDVAEQPGGGASEQQREEIRTTHERSEGPAPAPPNSPGAIDASNVLAARGGGPAAGGRGPAQPALSRTGAGPRRGEANRATKGSGRGD